MKIVFVFVMAVLCPAMTAFGQQGARYERWNGATLTSPQDLANNPTMLGAPSVSVSLVNFEAPVNVSGTFVARITAQVIAPETGNYIFWVASNGKSMAWISPDQNFAGDVPMAKMMQNVAPSRNQWTRYCEQKSGINPPVVCPGSAESNPVVSLVAGQTAYLLVVYMDTNLEATNINHASLRWQLPSGVVQGPIPGSRLTLPPPPPPPSNGTAELAWDPGVDVAGYRIRYGTASGNWTETVDVGIVTSARLTGLPVGSRLYFVAVAYDQENRISPPSNEVSCVPSSTSSCGSVQNTSLTDAWGMTSSTTGEGSLGNSLMPRRRNQGASGLRISDGLQKEDTWILDTSGWKRMFTVSWLPEPEEPERIASRDWVITQDPTAGLPGRFVSGAEIPFAPPGMLFWSKSVFVPTDGYDWSVIRGADWTTHNAVLLVAFDVYTSTDSTLETIHTGIVAVLEGNNGYALYLKGSDGNWSSHYVPVEKDFTIFIPGPAAWLSLYGAEK